MTDPIKNSDSRRMQPLPWRARHRDPGKCLDVHSVSGKAILSLWGGDTREPENYEWPTEEQMERHGDYVLHACNHFPLIQAEIERIYNMEEMPEEAIKAIEALMEKTYYQPGVPIYAK